MSGSGYVPAKVRRKVKRLLAARDLADGRAFDEGEVNRDHGKFAKKGGGRRGGVDDRPAPEFHYERVARSVNDRVRQVRAIVNRFSRGAIDAKEASRLARGWGAATGHEVLRHFDQAVGDAAVQFERDFGEESLKSPEWQAVRRAAKQAYRSVRDATDQMAASAANLGHPDTTPREIASQIQGRHAEIHDAAHAGQVAIGDAIRAARDAHGGKRETHPLKRYFLSDGRGDDDLYAVLAAAMLKVQIRATRAGHPESAVPALRRLAALAADPNRLAAAAGVRGLSWVPYLGKRGKTKGKQVGWFNTDTQAVRYQKAMPGRGRPGKDAVKPDRAKAKELLGHLAGGSGEPEHYAELAHHLPALTVAELREARRQLGASFGGSTQKQGMVDMLVQHARTKAPAPEPKKKPAPRPKPKPRKKAPARPKAPRYTVGGQELPERYDPDGLAPHYVGTAIDRAMRGADRPAMLAWLRGQGEGPAAEQVHRVLAATVPHRPGEAAADRLARAFAREDYLAEPPRPGEAPADFARRHFPALGTLRTLTVEGASSRKARANLYDLHEMLPHAKALAARGAEFFVSDAPVPKTDDMGHLAGIAPRGWDPGKTWDDAAGCYSNRDRKVIIGNGSDGSWSLAAHEAGHAIGDLYGLDDDPELIGWHEKLFDKLRPYEQQDGPGGLAGRQEMLAETIAVFVRGGQSALENVTSREYAGWVAAHLARIGGHGNVGEAPA